MVDPRFSQLLALAREGDEASVAQLWHEFNFDFHAECPCPVEPCSSGADTCHLLPDTRTPEGGAQC